MSAVKNLLGDTDFEKVEELLVEKGIDTEEATKIYDEAGGDDAYIDWANTYGLQLVDDWMKENEDLYTSEYDLMFDGGVFVLKSYIKYVTTLN